MELSKINLIIIILFFLFLPLVQAETTFFDQDDAFVMGDSAASGMIEGTTGGGGCTYKWNCTDWSKCLADGKQTRNCTNLGTCSETHKSPEIEQNCTYTVPAPLLPTPPPNYLPAPETAASSALSPTAPPSTIPLGFSVFAVFILILVALIIVYDLRFRKKKEEIHEVKAQNTDWQLLD